MYKLLLLLGLSVLVSTAPAEDKVDYLPGMDNFTYGTYSGYLEINGSDTRSLHYMFVES